MKLDKQHAKLIKLQTKAESCMSRDEAQKIIRKAEKAQSNSEKLVLGTQDSLEAIPEASISKVNFPAKAFYLFSKMELCSSSSEARRQILGGGVRIDGEKILDPNLEFETQDDLIGKILQVGKKKFLRVSN